MLLRDYKSCIENGYTAEEYAACWASDLYNQVFESAIECFWGNYLDVDPKYEDELSLSFEAEDECVSACYTAYEEAYLRYQREMEDPSCEVEPFEEWEVDDAVREVMEIITGEYSEQLDAILEKEEEAEENDS